MSKSKSEPIYPIGRMCDYSGCRNGGKLFEFGNTLVWICEKHQLQVLSKMFPNIKSQS